MEALKKKRSGARSTFTRTLNILKVEINVPNSEGVVADKFTKLESAFHEIKELDNGIIDFLAESDVSDEAINTERIDTETYFDEFITMKRLVGNALRNTCLTRENISGTSAALNGAVQAPSTINKQYQLPKLNIPVYDGTLINYLSFWSQFKKIHVDEQLEDCDKFQYLLQSVKPGTRARDLLESYPLTSENYKIAVTAFQERFGRKELLIEVYVRELLKLIITNVRAGSKDRLPLPDLFIKIDAYLRSLESMGLKSETNSAWLYPMVESSLPQDVLRAWQRSPLANSSDAPKANADANENVNSVSPLSRLMEFLRREVEGEERLKLARQGFDSITVKETRREKFKKPNVPTAAGLFSSKENCIFCSKSNHLSKDCIFARTLPLPDKIAKIQDKRCCLKCLKYGHFAKNCKGFVKCHVCSKSHTELMCPELSHKKENCETELVQSTIANAGCSSEVALMTLNVNIKGNKVKRIRALLDCGSQRSYILNSTAKELGLKPCATEHLVHTLFGGSHTEAKSHNRYLIKVFEPYLSISSEFEFLDQETICGEIPRVPTHLLIKEIKEHKIWLSDLGYGCSKIELLIGSDIYGKILTGKVKQLQSGLTAIQTKLGWVVCGQIQSHLKNNLPKANSMLAANLSMQEMKVPDLWKLETIGILDPVETLKKKEEEELAHDHFIKELSRNKEGRYSVGLPWTSGHPSISSNLHEAEKRLFSVTRRLKALNKLEEYNKVFQEWKDEDVIEKVSEKELGNLKCHYLPHHPIIKPDSLTTKLRPVFDASSKRGRTPSLNDCLLKGPNLIEQIPEILLRFRENPIGVVADIRRAFLQIAVKKEDRDYLRFLWWEKPDKIQVYRHKRVVFGVTCSPFLLEAVIRHHLSHVPQELKSIAEKLQNSFYIDNCISSLKDADELEHFINKATEIFAAAKMDLRLWEFGPFQEIESIRDKSLLNRDFTELVPVLGLRWDRIDDSLMISSRVELKTDHPSKREILSITQGIYDPIGFLTPVLLPAKLLVQEAWASKSAWDEPLPESIQEAFMKWYNELEILNDLKIPRRVGFGNKNYWTIHVCCDASLKAYATVIFLRCEEENDISVQLLAAKSRLAPLKKITVPRLELLACVLGARLCHFVRESLDIPDVPVYFWSDSSTSLAWIKRNDQWGTFVGNRVKEICRLTDPIQWVFVPGRINPADLPSRGCSPKQLLESRWWEGPEWLRRPQYSWPNEEVLPEEDQVLSERRKVVQVNLNMKSNATVWYERFSSFTRTVRCFAWMKRFIRNAQKKNIEKSQTLSPTEIQEAEDKMWQMIQHEHFPKISAKETNSINGLEIVEDCRGLFRVKTKIVEREDEFSFRYPLLLPSKHYLTQILIREYHLNNCHAGLQIMAVKLREKYWIISSKRSIRNVITKCVRCKRFTSKAQKTAPIHLPKDRVKDANVFEVTGVDLCGPFYLKNKSKAWCVLYTCAVYRCIHLEVVNALSTEVFVQSLRRFIARRGRPHTIYSDNGTNFAGTNNLLKNIDWDKIQTTNSLQPIKWKFIPPTAAWWGGWWERLIRSIKTLLLRTLGHSLLSCEELYTVLCDVESTVNGRPLTYISDGADNLVPLTPAMFLQSLSETGTPDLDKIDSKKLQLRYNHCQNLREELRSRFRREYLSQLVQKANSHHSELKAGDIVLVGLDNQKRLNWPMAKIVKFLPSRDGKYRVAELKTQVGTLIRPLQKLYPLEVGDSDPVLQCPDKRSRKGRIIRPPEKLSL